MSRPCKKTAAAIGQQQQRGLAKLTAAAIALAAQTFALTSIAGAAEFTVTSVVREIPMQAGEKSFRDVYINAGSNNGLRLGAFIDAVRRVAVYDNINSRVVGDTGIKIARLKIIHIDKNVAIARLVKIYEREKTPLIGAEAVMIGDLIEVSEHQ